MNTIEMMIEVFENGNKVKHTNWGDKQYLYEKDGVLHFNNGISDSTFPIKSMHDNWELYIEDNRKELPEGMEYLKTLYQKFYAGEVDDIGCRNIRCSECPLYNKNGRNNCNEIVDLAREMNKNFKLGDKPND